MNQLSLLSPEPEDEVLRQTDPTSSETIWGCDYGSGYFHCFNGKYLRLKPSQFASLDFANEFDTVVIENAHMQPKHRSLAQVFTQQELEAIADKAALRNIEVRLWFHSQTPKWRKMLDAGDKSDEVDAKTIYEIIRRRGLTDLQWFNPKPNYSPRVQWAHEQIDEMNYILNMARIDYEIQSCPAVQIYNDRMNGARVRSLHFAWNTHGHDATICRDMTNWFLGPDQFRQGLSLWAALVRWDGSPREYNGSQPGVKFIMNELLRQRPNHFRGGVARSNLMYWGFRYEAINHLKLRVNGKIDKKLHELSPQQQAKWLEHRRRYRKAMVCTLHAMKLFIENYITK